MTNKQIIEKAIQKAIDGGWNPQLGVLFVNKTTKYVAKYIADSREPTVFIFNHQFAKALWPMNLCECGTPYNETHNAVRLGKVTIHARKKDFKHHLQQMVIADDPIKYLGENI